MQNGKIVIYGWLFSLLVMSGQVSAAQDFSKNNDVQALCAALQVDKDFTLSRQLPAVPDDYFPETFTPMEQKAFRLYSDLKNAGKVEVPGDHTSSGKSLSSGEAFDLLCTSIEDSLTKLSLSSKEIKARTRKLSVQKGTWNDKYQRNEISLLLREEAERLKKWQAVREKAWDKEQGYTENFRTLLQAFKSLDRAAQQQVRNFEQSLHSVEADLQGQNGHLNLGSLHAALIAVKSE